MSENLTGQHLRVTLKENRSFPPSEHFVAQAKVQPIEYEVISKEAKSNPEKYWSDAALELTWFKHWDQVRVGEPPNVQWFVGGRINASFNCLDRHLKSQPHKAALVWEGEPGEVATWTYAELHCQVERFTAALRMLGLKTGDRVAIYMPMIPEAVVAMLACARGGFVHTVVFGGFNAEALKDRIQDAEAKVLITGDGGYRKGAWIDLKAQANQAASQCASLQHLVWVERKFAGLVSGTVPQVSAQPSSKSTQDPGKNRNWHELLAAVSHADCKRLGGAEPVDSEHPLFILYTSGTTGKPKGIVHSTGGYMTGVLRTTQTVFDLKPEDLYWCTADIGWVTGHSYLIYGPLAAGASVFMYEGAPNYPAPDRIW